MFSFLGLDEIALVAVLLVVLFNSRDLLNIYRTVNRNYLRLRRYFYRVRAELLYEPPTQEELKRSRDVEKAYRKYEREPDEAMDAAQQNPKDTNAG